MEESAKATTGLLLMMDKDDKRVLGYEQFAKLILAIAAAANSSFDEVADDLTLALTSEDAELDEEVLRELTIADEAYGQARDREREEKEHKKVMDALSYRRTTRLFDLWDVDGSGTIGMWQYYEFSYWPFFGRRFPYSSFVILFLRLRRIGGRTS